MKVGDIVKPRAAVIAPRVGRVYGIVLDFYESDDGLMYLEVQWEHEKEWWSPLELELVSESR